MIIAFYYYVIHIIINMRWRRLTTAFGNFIGKYISNLDIDKKDQILRISEY